MKGDGHQDQGMGTRAELCAGGVLEGYARLQGRVGIGEQGGLEGGVHPCPRHDTGAQGYAGAHTNTHTHTHTHTHTQSFNGKGPTRTARVLTAASHHGGWEGMGPTTLEHLLPFPRVLSCASAPRWMAS